MMPERWARVKALFTAALERPPQTRAAYLAEACGDDEALRQEIEALLLADGEAASIETGAVLGVHASGASPQDVTTATTLQPGSSFPTGRCTRSGQAAWGSSIARETRDSSDWRRSS